MRRVIDCSAAFKWVVTETDSDKAIRLRDDFRNGIIELIAPDILGRVGEESPDHPVLALRLFALLRPGA